jgi:predicted nucleic acid-binding protein
MLLDTSGLLAYHHRREPQHADAQTFYAAATTRIVHSYILAEFVALAQARGLPRQPALQFIQDLLENPDIEVIWVDETLNRKALDYLQSRGDKTYSLCDAVSFVIMAERSMTEALTTDYHFEQAGFRRLLA